MKITSLQEYGVRCLLQLAEAGTAQPVQIRAIAEREGLSADYVGKILTRLRRSGLVRSVRGLKGGYALACAPEQISVGQAILALSERPIDLQHLKRDLCRQFPGNRRECVHLRACSVRQIWSMVVIKVYGSLNRIPLSRLLGTEAEVQGAIAAHVRGDGKEEEVKIPWPA